MRVRRAPSIVANRRSQHGAPRAPAYRERGNSAVLSAAAYLAAAAVSCCPALAWLTQLQRLFIDSRAQLKADSSSESPAGIVQIGVATAVGSNIARNFTHGYTAGSAQSVGRRRALLGAPRSGRTKFVRSETSQFLAALESRRVLIMVKAGGH